MNDIQKEDEQLIQDIEQIYIDSFKHLINNRLQSRLDFFSCEVCKNKEEDYDRIIIYISNKGLDKYQLELIKNQLHTILYDLSKYYVSYTIKYIDDIMRLELTKTSRPIEYHLKLLEQFIDLTNDTDIEYIKSFIVI